MPVAKAGSDAFNAVADPTRRAMLERLAPRDAERTAGELGSGLGLGQSTLSQHLRVLREAGLVEVREEGRCRIYRLRPEPLSVLHQWVNKVVSFGDPAGHVWTVRRHEGED